MPCYDPRDSPEQRIAEAEQKWRHNSDVAQMLCEAMTFIQNLENVAVAGKLSGGLMQWWKDHQERDKAKNK